MTSSKGPLTRAQATEVLLKAKSTDSPVDLQEFLQMMADSYFWLLDAEADFAPYTPAGDQGHVVVGSPSHLDAAKSQLSDYYALDAENYYDDPATRTTALLEVIAEALIAQGERR